jgi:hypothetical protein
MMDFSDSDCTAVMYMTSNGHSHIVKKLNPSNPQIPGRRAARNKLNSQLPCHEPVTGIKRVLTAVTWELAFPSFVHFPPIFAHCMSTAPTCLR